MGEQEKERRKKDREGKRREGGGRDKWKGIERSIEISASISPSIFINLSIYLYHLVIEIIEMEKQNEI